MSSSPRLVIVLATMIVGALSGCSCGEKGTIPIDRPDVDQCLGSKACTADSECEERNICKLDKNTGARCCVRTFRSCADDSNCCPGQVCTADGRCADKFDECTADLDCGEGGDRVCEDWTDPTLGVTKRCTYKKCDPALGCAAGQSCFDGFCVAAPPCGGSCPSGSACVPQNNRCHPYGTRCSVTCKPGFLAVFTNPGAVYDVCKLADVACDCKELPPLFSNDLGRHCSIAAGPASSNKISVAYYDGQYGDLVVSDFDSSGAKKSTTWVDGVPATGTVVAGPSGARNGILEPGDNVGKYTDSATGPDGTLYVSYYDETNGDLKYAERDATGKWLPVQTLDGSNTDCGLYTSIALDVTGNPAIAYFQRGGSDTSSSCPSDPTAAKAHVTGVKLAQAKVPHPSAITDWKIEMVDCAGRTPPPCYGCETAGAKVCTVGTTTPTVCSTPAASCNPACATGEVCIDKGGGAVGCAKQGSSSELADIPPGRGLFPSLAFKGTTPVIAYYDHTRGNLVVSQKTGASWTAVTIDGETGSTDTGDVGLYPSLAIDGGGGFNIAYHDFTRRGLRYYSSKTLTAVTSQTNPSKNSFVDTGLFDPTLDGPSWVGADASLIFAAGGTFVAYQNATGADLRLAKRDPVGSAPPLGPDWNLVQQWDKGAQGFFADIAELDGKIYVVHASIHAKTVSGKPAPDNALHLEIITP